MTKKTNSLILRLGLSNFWMNKNIRNEVMWKRFQMENLLTNELKKFRFLYITGVFSKKLVHIFFYNDFIKNFKVLNIIRSYSFWNWKSLKEISEKFSVSERRVSLVLSKRRLKSHFLQKEMLLQLITNRYLRNRCIKVLKKVIDSSYLLLNSYLLFLKIMLKVFKRICIFRSLRSRFFRKRFRKKFSILKMRIVELFMMMNVFLSVGYFMVLRLENVLFSYGLYRRYKMPKKDSKLDFLCFIAIQFCTSELLGNYLCRNLSLVKNHFRVLRKFMSTVEKFYLKSRFNFYGLLIRIAGKLQGKMRKSKYQYKIGKANRQVFKIPISYFFGISVTRFGVLSIKVWLFFYENNS